MRWQRRAFTRGEFSEAEALYKRALGKRVLQPNCDTGSLNGLAKICVLQGRYREAQALYRRAIDIISKPPGTVAPDDRTFNGLAEIYVHQGRYSDATAGR